MPPPASTFVGLIYPTNLLTVGRVVVSYCNFYAPLSVFSVWAIATMNVRYLNHAFVNIDIAPLIVTNAVLSTLCKSLPMNRNAECFREYFLGVFSCQVKFWSMTSLNVTHVTLYSVSVFRISCFKPCSFSRRSQNSRVCSTPFLRQTMSKTKMATNRRNW